MDTVAQWLKVCDHRREVELEVELSSTPAEGRLGRSFFFFRGLPCHNKSKSVSVTTCIDGDKNGRIML